MNKVKTVLILGVIVSFGVSGYAYWRSMQPKAFIRVWGDAILDKAVIGATVGIYDLDGNKIYEQKGATHTTGSFLIKAPWGIGRWSGEVPSSFRIVATGGTLGDKPFTGRIMREVYSYNEGAYYKLNAVSTLIAAYRAKHPEVAYVKAEEAVEHFLQVPSKVGIAYLIDHSEVDCTLFDHFAFMIQAEEVGGFDAYMDVLVKQIEAGKHLKLPSVAREAEGGGLSFIGRGIANGVLSWGTGQAIGWVFHALGYRTGSEHMLEEMSKRLAMIQETLYNVERLQEETLRKIEELTKRLEEVYKGLKWEIEIATLKTRSSTIVTAITEPISRIKVSFDSLQRYSKVNPAKVDEELRRLVDKTVDEILSPLIGIEPYLETLHENIVGFLGEKGLLELWSTLVTVGATSTGQINEMYRALEDRFAYLLGMELTGIAIMVDAYHGKYGNNTQTVADFWKTWKGRIRIQVDLFLRSVERLAASRIDTLTADEFNNHQFVYAPPVMISEQYTPPVILQRADKFAQDLLGSLEAGAETSQGVITVRIVNYPHLTQKLPADIGLQLQDVETGKVYSAGLVERRDGNTIPDRGFNTVPYELVCYAFTVPLGTYKLGSLDERFPKLLGAHDCSPTTTVTNSNRYGSRGVMAYSETIPTYSKWGSQITPAVQFFDPRGAAVDSTRGYVYVVDGGGYVLKFDLKGKYILNWGTKGRGNGQFWWPRGVAVDSSGYVYVVDHNNFRIQKFDEKGKFITKWGSQGRGNGQFGSMDAVAMDGSGYVYVGDGGNHRIQKFDSNGKFITAWGSVPAAGVAVDNSGYVYVAGASEFWRVQKFDSNGRFILEWGSHGSGDGQFNFLRGGVAVDNTRGYVYVPDTNNHRIQKFDSNGNFITKWGSYGSGEGQFNYPFGVAVDSARGTVYVSDGPNRCVQVWFLIVFVSRNW